MKDNIVMHWFGHGELQSGGSLPYKHHLNWKTFQFSHTGHVMQFLNFSCLSTRWGRRRFGGGAEAVGNRRLCFEPKHPQLRVQIKHNIGYNKITTQSHDAEVYETDITP